MLKTSSFGINPVINATINGNMMTNPNSTFKENDKINLLFLFKQNSPPAFIDNEPFSFQTKTGFLLPEKSVRIILLHDNMHIRTHHFQSLLHTLHT